MPKSIGHLLNRNTLRLLINVVFFQLVWAVAVLLGDMPALVLTGAYLILHQLFLVEHPREWVFIAGIVTIGVVADSSFKLAGVLDFGDDELIIPPWLICLWVMFAATLCHSLRWFQKLPLLAAAFAAVAGPTSYYAGARLSDVDLGKPLWQSLLVLSIWWAIMFPLVMRTTRWVRYED